MIERPFLGRLTQGCIFTCANAADYPCVEVHGFVITARCDVEQEKSPVLNYLPIVPFDAWLERDGLQLFTARLRAELKGAFKSAMLDAKIPESLLVSQTVEQIVALGASQVDKSTKSALVRMTDNSQKISKLNALVDMSEVDASSIFSMNDKIAKQLIKDLITNQLTGYYFLQDIKPDSSQAGHVVLLREVSYLNWELGRAVAAGLEASAAEPLLRGQELSFHANTFAEPVGELRSPHVEHVMQCFSSLFGRIGLPDTPKPYIEKMCARRPPKREGARHETHHR